MNIVRTFHFSCMRQKCKVTRQTLVKVERFEEVVINTKTISSQQLILDTHFNGQFYCTCTLLSSYEDWADDLKHPSRVCFNPDIFEELEDRKEVTVFAKHSHFWKITHWDSSSGPASPTEYYHFLWSWPPYRGEANIPVFPQNTARGKHWCWEHAVCWRLPTSLPWQRPDAKAMELKPKTERREAAALSGTAPKLGASSWLLHHFPWLTARHTAWLPEPLPLAFFLRSSFPTLPFPPVILKFPSLASLILSSFSLTVLPAAAAVKVFLHTSKLVYIQTPLHSKKKSSENSVYSGYVEENMSYPTAQRNHIMGTSTVKGQRHMVWMFFSRRRNKTFIFLSI